MFVSFLLLIFCRSLSQSQGQRSGAPAGPIPACSFCSCFDSCPLPVSFIAASLLARDRPSRIDRRLSAFRAPARRSDAGGGASSLLGLSAPGPPKQAGADFHYLFCLAGLGGNQGMHTHTGSTFSSPLGAASGGDSYCTRSFLASPSAILIFLFPCFYIYIFFQRYESSSAPQRYSEQPSLEDIGIFSGYGSFFFLYSTLSAHPRRHLALCYVLVAVRTQEQTWSCFSRLALLVP